MIEDIKFKFDYYLTYGVSTLKDILQFLHISKSNLKQYRKQMKLDTLCFQVSTQCNSNCIFCISPKIKREYKIMSFEIFKKAIDDYDAMGGKKINLTPMYGEPLLDTNLFTKIKYAKEKGMYVYLFTNGSLLSLNDNYEKLIDSGIDRINISTPGFSEELYKNVFGVNNYSQTLKGIHNLLKYNKVTEINFHFRSSEKPSKLLKEKDFQEFIKPYLSPKVRIGEFLNNYDDWCGQIKKGDLKGVMKFGRNPLFRRFPCRIIFDAMILHEGSVRLCGCRINKTEFDDLVIGNITNQSLKDIYYGNIADYNIEKFYEENAPEVCKKCAFYVPATNRWFKKRIKRRWKDEQ